MRDVHSLRPQFWFGDVDARPLALFRIAFGLLMLKDALYHIPLAHLLYSDAGVLPRATALQFNNYGRFSLLYWLPETWMVVLFLVAWALISVGFIVGYRTHLMTVLQFLFTLSLINRNLYLANGGDLVRQVLIFWCLFLPLGAYYSADSYNNRQNHSVAKTTFALPLRCIQLQICLIYLVTGLLKLRQPAWRSGEAMYNYLQYNVRLLPLGSWLFENSPEWGFLLMTWGALLIELVFLFFIFSPVLQPYLRFIAIMAGIGLHIGIGFTLSIYNFSLIMLISYLLLLQPEWIERIEKRLRRGNNRIVAPTAPAQYRWKYTKPLVSVTLIIFMGLVVWLNLRAIMPRYIPRITGVPRTIMATAGLGQRWNMFTQQNADYGIVKVIGETDDNQFIDLETGDAPLELIDKPRRQALRWFQFRDTLRLEQPVSDPVFEGVGAYYCAVSDSSLRAVQFVYYYQISAEFPTTPNPKIHTQTVWQQDCSS